ncbi:7816_t:CDS:2, partial [Cetraspora pellucida]
VIVSNTRKQSYVNMENKKEKQNMYAQCKRKVLEDKTGQKQQKSHRKCRAAENDQQQEYRQE